MKIQSLLRRRNRQNIFTAVAAIGLIGTFVSSIPDAQKRMVSIAQIRDHAAVISQEQEITRMDKERLIERSKVADKLYETGCNNIVVSPNDPSKFASLVKGTSIINPNTGQVLAAGLSVCTNTGEAAVLVDNGTGVAVVGDIYTTQNFALVRQALNMHGINAQSGDGKVGGANAQIKH